MIKVEYKVRLALLVAVQAAVLLLVALVSYRPSVAAISDAQKKLTELSKRQDDLFKALKASPSPEADIERAQAEIRRLENRMPPESRVSWLSARIADAMQANQIDLRSATHWHEGGEAPPVPELKRLQKSITIHCTAGNLQAFLQAVNRLPFAVVVEDLEVRRNRQWGVVSAEIKLATFVLRVSPGAASWQTPSPEVKTGD